MCLIMRDYVCMCLVLFVVSKILDSSELLSCLLETGVEYYLVCIREGLLCGRAWSHREAAGGEVELGRRSCFYVVTKVIGWIMQVL